jgi:hypothetical protein
MLKGRTGRVCMTYLRAQRDLCRFDMEWQLYFGPWGVGKKVGLLCIQRQPAKVTHAALPTAAGLYSGMIIASFIPSYMRRGGIARLSKKIAAFLNDSNIIPPCLVSVS